MDEEARPATGADVGRLAELVRQAVAELAVNRGGRVWSRRTARQEPIEDGLTADLADPDRLVLVGTIDGTPIGYAMVVDETLADGGHLAVVADIYVEPEARGVGVGEALMDQAVAWAEARSCIGIDALALPGDRHTKNFFETFGLTARAIVVHRDLRAP